jgi:hypothetical protein
MRAAILIVLIALGGVVHAEEISGDRKAAERHFRAGEKAYAMQNFEAAAANFDEAFKALPLPEIAFSAGQAYRRQYRVDSKLEYAKKAVEHYRYYLDRVKTGGKVGVAADALGEMQREVDKLTSAGMKMAPVLEVERTRLGISPVLGTERADSMREIGDLPDEKKLAMAITIDGKPAPPYQMVEVDVGSHKIHIEVEGYIPIDTVESVIKGESKSAMVAMKPKPGRITVKTERDARVRVDGRAVSGLSFEVPAGKHLITVLRSGRETVAREVEVGRGQELAFAQPLRKTPRRRAVPFVLGAAAITGALTLGGAIYLGTLNADVEDTLAAIRAGDQRPDVLADYRAATSRRSEVLTGTLITGGITLGIVGVAAALYWLDRPDDEGLRLAPLANSSTAGVTAIGRF